MENSLPSQEREADLKLNEKKEKEVKWRDRLLLEFRGIKYTQASICGNTVSLKKCLGFLYVS